MEYMHLVMCRGQELCVTAENIWDFQKSKIFFFKESYCVEFYGIQFRQVREIECE